MNGIWSRSDSDLIWVKRFKKLWASDLPMEGKTFIWQILKIGLFSRARAKTIGKSDGLCNYYLFGVETVGHIFFDFIRAQHYWNSTTRYYAKHLDDKTTMDSPSLIAMIDGALAPCPQEVSKPFVIHQTLREMWITKNLLVFQKEFKQFLAAKVEIFMVERMLAI